MIRLLPSPSRSGARPSVAKSMAIRELPTEARGGREEAVDAEVIMRGVIITGATKITDRVNQ